MADEQAAETPRVERCEACRFYVDQHDEPAIGWCHRYPPTIPQDPPDDGPISYFAEVRPHSWCGEFKPKEPTVLDTSIRVFLDGMRGNIATRVRYSVSHSLLVKGDIDKAAEPTVRDLIQLTGGELRQNGSVGAGSLYAVREALAKHGLKLKGD